MKIKKYAAAALSALMLTGIFTGCGEEEITGVINYTTPKEGEKIAVMTIKDYGDVKIKLFPNVAEKGVENFTKLAEDGYYDGLIFHRVINNFMIQGGDPTGTGTGGESIFGGKFDGGTSDNLIHAQGAVAYANSGGTNTNGSQFYIVTGETYDESTLTELGDYYGITFSDEAKKIYTEYGGTPWLDGGYTVFGQVFDGLDLILQAQTVETDSSDKPLENLVIEKITIEEYNGEDVKFYLSDYQ